MTSRDPNPTCDTFAEWLADALDGTLAGPFREPFEAHRTSCASCRELEAAATEGRGWLRELPVVAPPPELVGTILEATRLGTPLSRQSRERDSVRATPQAELTKPAPPQAELTKLTTPQPRWTKLSPRPWLTKLGEGLAAIAYQPRLAMTGAMAFFSLSMIANLTGASVQDLRRLDPRAFASDASLRYHAATAGLVRYYDNNRFLRELEVGLRDLREAAEGESAEKPAAPEQESENHG
jgi:hypothetical protein